MVCADGATVSGSVKVPCTEPHNWRAVTTIALGDAEGRLPGDRLVRGHHPRLLLEVGRRLAELPRRLRLRLHVVPRGRVGRRQPPFGLLGEDGPVNRLLVVLRPRVLALLAGCTGERRRPSEPAARPRRPRAASTAAGRRPAARAAGRRAAACYRLDYDEAVAPTDDADAGPLRERRTPSMTYAVGAARHRRRRPPAGRRLRRGSQSQVATTCPDAVRGVRRRHARGPAAEHAARGLVHPDRARSPTPARRGTAATSSPWRATSELAPLTGRLAGRARHAPRAATATACAAPPRPAPRASSG